jgi:hypothetical protein
VGLDYSPVEGIVKDKFEWGYLADQGGGQDAFGCSQSPSDHQLVFEGQIRCR